jgi:hypothetical protein
VEEIEPDLLGDLMEPLRAVLVGIGGAGLQHPTGRRTALARARETARERRGLMTA